MHRLTFILLAALALVATSTTGFAAAPEEFGQKLTLNQVTPVSTIMAAPDTYVGQRVLIKGMVVDVCAKRGCWMEIASDKAFEKIQVKVLDGEIVFPMSARGKEAVVEGVVEALKYSKEEAVAWFAHKAEEKGEAFDAGTVKGPMTIYRIKALGARITE